MRPGLLFLIGVAGILGTVALPPVPGAEAVFPNGMRIQGAVQVGRDGQLLFVTAGRSFGLASFAQVRFGPFIGRSLPERAVLRITLGGGQHLSGELLEVTPDAIRVLPAWTDKPLLISRSLVVALGHPPGQMTLLHEDFENGLAQWKVRGAPQTSEQQHRTGRRSLLLDSPRQRLEYVLPEAIQSGRVGLNYRAAVPQPAGAHWLVEADFGGDDATSRVSVELAGRGNTLVREAPELAPEGTGTFVPTGWHRLRLEWMSDSLLVQVDDQVLYHERRKPTGPLRKVRLHCLGGPAARVLGGEVWVDDLVIVRFVDELPRPASEPGQDELWLHGGDQLFGSVTRADSRSIQVQGRFGTRTFSWADVRAIYFRRQAASPRRTEGEPFWLWLGAGDELGDELEGPVATFDDRRLILNHPALGAVTVDRVWLRRLAWRSAGR